MEFIILRRLVALSFCLCTAAQGLWVINRSLVPGLQHTKLKDRFFYLVSQFTLKLLGNSTEDCLIEYSWTIFEDVTILEKQDERVVHARKY